MEHGRWVVERLEDGWRLGATRDVTKKTSPYLVPWSLLSDELKERDRTAVRTIPELLAQEGIEIFRE